MSPQRRARGGPDAISGRPWRMPQAPPMKKGAPQRRGAPWAVMVPPARSGAGGEVSGGPLRQASPDGGLPPSHAGRDLAAAQPPILEGLGAILVCLAPAAAIRGAFHGAGGATGAGAQVSQNGIETAVGPSPQVDCISTVQGAPEASRTLREHPSTGEAVGMAGAVVERR